jgi:N-methylhydantoinase A
VSEPTTAEYILGVDIGGTFTDAVAVDVGTGAVTTAKSPSTPADPIQGVLAAIQLLAEDLGLRAEQLLGRTSKFAHGTTLTSNVVFTWSGARTGLLTTKGFGDEILIMKAVGRVAGIPMSDRRHFRATDKPPAIVPKGLISEVDERVDHRGGAIVPLTEQEGRRAIQVLLDKGVEAIAISLLWAHENPAHELLLEELVKDMAPHVYTSTSHRLAPVIGEYERTTTTAVNAYVGPTIEHYLSRLAEQLQEHGLQQRLLVLQASGGVTQAEETVPINTIESGPAAGTVAVRAQAQAAGLRNVIATDVGGTTFKVGLLRQGEWSSARQIVVNQYSLLVPMVDLVSIGAGGGSVAWVDHGRLRIGPQSAGADPGPVCYGWGGTEPTVTDADAVLGFLSEDHFLGGRLRLDLESARAAIKSKIADPLFDGDVMAAAAGIRRVVDAQMGDLVRKMTVERGHDPRQFDLMAYGGAGPLHACGYAAGIGVGRIIIPRAATVFSAYGAASSDIHYSAQRSGRNVDLDDGAALERMFAALRRDAGEALSRHGIEEKQQALNAWAEMRYQRQWFDLRVDVEWSDPAELPTLLRDNFQKKYAALYGKTALLSRDRITVTIVGVDGVGLIDKPAISELPPVEVGNQPRPASRRPVLWPEVMESLDTEIYDGMALRPGHELTGPAVLDLPGTTVAVPPGAVASIDSWGNIIIQLGN